MASWLSGIVDISIRTRLRTYNKLAERMMSEWANLDGQAEEAAIQEWQRLTNDSVPGGVDEPTMAATAVLAGEEFYQTIFPLGQAMTNLFTAGLFHLFEQQLAVLARAMMSSLDVPSSMAELFTLLNRQLHIDISATYPRAARLNELRLIANVIKHAEGPSADKLRHLRPDLFERCTWSTLSPGTIVRTGLVREPLAGDGIFVSKQDFDDYARDVDAFWVTLMRDLDRTFA
jgi:hypothetical protein